MTIAFLSDAIFPYHKGGKEKRLYELSTRLAKLGHDVHIYTMHWWQTPENERVEDGVYLHAIARYHPLYHDDRRSITQGILFGLASFKLSFARFDMLDVDHMPYFPVFSAWVVCRLRGKQLFGTWHEALSTKEWVAYMGKTGYIAAVIEKLAIALPRHIIAASPQTQKRLSVLGYCTKQLDTVSSGIDFNTIKRLRSLKDMCDVLYVGRLVKDKNVDVLIRAMAIVVANNPKVHCTIIGHGIEQDNLQQLINQLNLSQRVTVLGSLQQSDDIYRYMKSAKVFVLPSVREGFGIVALEALSCGTPVITINTPANAAKDLVSEGKTGSIVALDEVRIADAITYWTSSGKKPFAVDQYAQYDWNILAAKLAQIYEA